jgi:monoamine oxidase
MSRTPALRKLIQLFHQAHQANLQEDLNQLPSGATDLGPSLGSRSTSLRRRKFIKLAALSSGAAIAAGTLSQSPIAVGNSAPRIAIIGGGIAGLNAAYQLKKAGIHATVYEARSRLGGRMYSVTGQLGPGIVSDLGGSFINTDHAEMMGLVKDFNLTLFNRITDPAIGSTPEMGYYFEGRIRSEAELADKLRPLARIIARDNSRLNQDFATYGPQFDQYSVKDYLDNAASQIPEPWIRKLIELSIRTEYGVEPDQSSCLELLFLVPSVTGNRADVISSSDEAYVVQGGSGLIIERLGQSLNGQIQTQMPLQRVAFNGRTYWLTFQNNQTIEADYVIMALPFTILRNLDLQVTLPPLFQKMIREVSLGKDEKILAGFSQKLWRQPFGFVSELWADLGFAQVLDDTQRQARNDGALAFYFGGKEVDVIQSGSAASQGQRMVDRLNQIIPNITAVATQKFLRTNWLNDPFTKGAYTTFKPSQLTQFSQYFYVNAKKAADRQEVRFSNLFFVGEHLSDAYYGYMNGAAETGRLAAESLIRQFQVR